jgi:hypothetical protein
MIEYDMVVESPYGTEARIKHMKTTCHVDRFRDSSAVYPSASKFESAVGLSDNEPFCIFSAVDMISIFWSKRKSKLAEIVAPVKR